MSISFSFVTTFVFFTRISAPCIHRVSLKLSVLKTLPSTLIRLPVIILILTAGTNYQGSYMSICITIKKKKEDAFPAWYH